MKYVPRPYQKYAINRLLNDEAVALMLDMGLGKTSIVLTVIKKLLQDKAIKRPLIIAPKKVAEATWDSECGNWDHLKSLTCSKILGTSAKRISALKERADIYIINRENVCWLVSLFGRKWPFDMVVIDESSSFKSPRAKRFKALKLVRPMIKRIVELTGTPAPNGLMDLWTQMYLLDKGERLGRQIGTYRRKYFIPELGPGFIIYGYHPRPDAKEEIYSKISDICVSMKSEDYLALPDIIYNRVPVKLSNKAMGLYKEMEKNWILELDEKVTAQNAASLSMKLSQLANGFLYYETGGYLTIHEEKIEALKELAETGKHLLVFYWFNADKDKLKQAFPKARELNNADDLKDWNEGKIEMLLAHPASAGHGLNLQYGGNIIVWYSLTWSLEYYQQANKRLHRSGQTETVIIHHLVAEGTVDEMILKAISRKEAGQNALLQAVKAKIKEIQDVYKR